MYTILNPKLRVNTRDPTFMDSPPTPLYTTSPRFTPQLNLFKDNSKWNLGALGCSIEGFVVEPIMVNLNPAGLRNPKTLNPKPGIDSGALEMLLIMDYIRLNIAHELIPENIPGALT